MRIVLSGGIGLAGKIVVAVGSLRRPKLAAVERAMKAVAPHLCGGTEGAVAAVEVTGREVASGVGHTPTSRDELMRGARGRAENLIELSRKEAQRWDHFVGSEGGLDVVSEGNSRRVFLESSAYVADSTGRKTARKFFPSLLMRAVGAWRGTGDFLHPPIADPTTDGQLTEDRDGRALRDICRTKERAAPLRTEG